MGKKTLQLFALITILFIPASELTAQGEIPVQLSYSSDSTLQSTTILREDVSCLLTKTEKYSTRFEWKNESEVTTSPSTKGKLRILSKATGRELSVNGKNIEPFEPLGLTKTEMKPTGHLETIDSGALIRLLPQLPLIFSEKAVKKGDSWTAVFKEAASFPLKTTVTYTLKNITSDNNTNRAIIAASCNLTTDIPENHVQVALHAKAHYIFDLNSGTIMKSSGNSDYSLVWAKKREGLPQKRVRKSSFTTTNSLSQ